MTAPFTPEQEARLREIIREEADIVPFTLEQERRIDELIDLRWQPLGGFLEAGRELAEAVRSVTARRKYFSGLYESLIHRRRKWGERSPASPFERPDGRRP